MFYAGTLATFSGPKGHYKEDVRLDRQTYADVMANFNKTFGDFNIVANVGASIKDTRMKSSVITGNLELVTINFTIENPVPYQ